MFTILVCQRGVPALRQDWSWFSNTLAPLPALAYATSIWDPSGLGGFNPLVTSYPFYFWGQILAHACGPAASFVLVICAIAAYASICAVRATVAAGGRAHAFAALLAAIFLLFNPWTYTEIVAGHLIMVISYLGLAALACEALNAKPSSRAIVFATLAAGLQLQFLIFAAPLVALLCRKHKLWAPAAMWLVLAIPEAITIVAGYGELLRTPFTIPWEHAQGLDVGQALTLTGYFAGYTAAFGGIFLAAAWVLVAVALYGITAGGRTRAIVTVAITGVIAILWASAPKTWLAPVFDAAYGHIAPLGVFRELYDVLVLAAIAICILVTRAVLHHRVAALVCTVAVAALPAYWLLHPPSQYWIGRAELPRVAVDAPENSRFLLLPAIQPLTYHGAGLGMDPDRVARERNVTPLNVFYAAYPVQAAIAAYLQSGSTSEVSALSASAVIARADYQTDVATLRGQLGGTAPAFRLDRAPRRLTSFTPELTVLSGTSLCSLCSRFGSGNTLIGDAPHGATLRAVSAGHAFANVRDGWTDAALLFISRPELAQPLGGVATTNPREALHLPPEGRDLLVYVKGRLIDGSGRDVAAPQGRYAWVSLAKHGRTLLCRGFCVVAAAGNVPQSVPLNPPPQHYAAVPFGVPVPWLAIAQVRASGGILRYNTAYNPFWFAFVDGIPLPHVRLDGSVNGWRIATPVHGRLILLQAAAALAACAEFAGIALSSVLLFMEFRVGIGAVLKSAYDRRKMKTDAAG